MRVAAVQETGIRAPLSCAIIKPLEPRSRHAGILEGAIRSSSHHLGDELGKEVERPTDLLRAGTLGGEKGSTLEQVF